MIPQITYFSDALTAWEQWNLADIEYRYEHLMSFKLSMREQHPELTKLIHYHLAEAYKLLSTSHHLIGPTGETNELYLTGRGVTLLLIENNTLSENVLFSAFSMLSAALLAGNSVIVCSDNTEVNQLVSHALKVEKLPANLIQLTAFETAFALLENDIRALGFIGSELVLHQLNLQLARRKGPIVNPVFETQLETPVLMHDPELALRFITERTRTINITAVGGNTSLLAQGDDATHADPK